MDSFEILTCPICGKKFTVWDRELYQWKFKENIYCSYTCMRVDEKKHLSLEKIFEDGVTEKEKLPEELKEVYSDLMRLRRLSRVVSAINSIKIRYSESNKAGTSLQKFYRKYLYQMKKIRCKYVDGVEKLEKEQWELLSRFALKYLEIEDISQTLGLDYKTMCEKFKDTMKILKDNQSNQKVRNRWNFVGC